MSVSDTPVLLLIFNRPDKVRELIASLEKIKPKKIYISADGPRSHIPSDKNNCEEARKIAINLSWECQIYTNFSNENLGCMSGPVKGISWFFSNEEMGIILEDDCIPTNSFFSFTTELLEKYKDNERVMHINGTSFITPEQANSCNSTYYFSAITFVWGWASWRRAWQHFDIKMSEIMETENKLIQNKIFIQNKHRRFWVNLFKHVKNKPQLGIWDAQWAFTVMSQNGINITPTKNLIENIGFGNDATHTTERFPHASKSYSFSTETVHPNNTAINRQLDEIIMDKVFYISFWGKILIFFRKIANRI